MTAADIKVGNFGPGYFANLIYTSPTAPKRVNLNFKCGDDYPLHINPRYDDQVLVLNTLVNKKWQREERPPGFPLGGGQHTQITAAANDKTFDIFVNKMQFSYSYNYRYDVSKVNHIHFSGGGQPIEASIGKILPNFDIGKVIYIKGQAPSGGTFVFNLVPSYPSDYKTENIAMHMSFRFGENTVVRNHRIDMKWAHEERDGGMPVTPGQPFSMTIVAQKTGFEVGVNGDHFCHFRYRVPLTKEMCVEMANVPYVEKIAYN